MPDTHDYPLAQVLNTGNLVHHARPAGLFGRHLETRCGLEGQRTGRDGGVWCPECVALERAKADTHDERGGDETPLARVQAFQRAANPNGDYHWPAEEAANVNGVPLYFDDIESLTAADNFDAVDAVVARWRKAEEQLAAVTARAEKAEAALAHANSVVGAFHAEADRMSDRYDNLRGDYDRLRAQVAELGEPTEWGQPRTEWTWSARKPDGAAVPLMYPDPHPPRTEESVRHEFDGVVDNMGYRKVLLCREITAWRDANGGWSSRRPDASLDGLRGPFTGLLGPLGIEADPPGMVPTAAENPPDPEPCRGCGETYCDDSRETKP